MGNNQSSNGMGFNNNVTDQGRDNAIPSDTSASHDDIARRAYEIYNESGRKQGRCRANWNQAERELQKPPAPATAAVFAQAQPAAITSRDTEAKTVADVTPIVAVTKNVSRDSMPYGRPPSRVSKL